MVSFVIPIVGDLIIKQSIESPQGGDILLTQRESVNDAWDLPVEETMQAFFATHPDYRNYSHSKKGFDWGWYYAFQQLGDQAAAELSADYRKASLAKYQLAGYVTILSPPILLQRLVTRLAETDAVAAFEYEAKIREFHQQLRHFYYPWLFIRDDFSNSKLEALPQFTPSKGYAAQAN
jgi:ABC-2 type transport system permease protein